MSDEAVGPRPFAWGIVGAGAIAEVFANAIRVSGVGRVAGVLGRSRSRGLRFAARHDAPAFDSLDALLSVPGLGAVYVATPHSAHYKIAAHCLKAGRAVLCEKPMTLVAAETAELVAIARAERVPLVEGWMYRLHPQIGRLVETVRSRRYGTVRRVEACFGFVAEDGGGRQFDPARGGGAIFDVGGYPLSFALLVAGAAGQSPCVDMVDVEGTIAKPEVDATASATLRFSGALEARLDVSIVSDLGMRARVEFERASLTLLHPFLPDNERHGRRAEWRLEREGVPEKRIVTEAGTDCFSLEAGVVRDLVEKDAIEPPPPMVGHAESIRLAELLGQWRAGVLAGTSPRLSDPT